MKNSKRLTEEQLFNQIAKDITDFVTTKEDLQKRIEDLIKNNYIMRDLDDTNYYLDKYW